MFACVRVLPEWRSRWASGACWRRSCTPAAGAGCSPPPDTCCRRRRWWGWAPPGAAAGSWCSTRSEERDGTRHQSWFVSWTYGLQWGFIPSIRTEVCACSQRGCQNTYSPHNIMSYFIDNRYAAHLLHLLLVFTLRTIVNSTKSRLHYIFQIHMHNKNCLRGGKWGGKGWFWGGISHPSPPHGGATGWSRVDIGPG